MKHKIVSLIFSLFVSAMISVPILAGVVEAHEKPIAEVQEIDLDKYVVAKNNEEEALGVEYEKKYNSCDFYLDVTELHVEATAYCNEEGNLTATGTKTTENLTCAFTPKYYGWSVDVYEDDNGKVGKFIGTYIVQDTGGDAIRSGKVIDIYMENKTDAINFGRKDVIVFLTKAEG